MTEFVIFVILTCGEITDTVLFDVNNNKYMQGSIPMIQAKLKKISEPDSPVAFVKVKNNTGVCS